jgi:hypothetical protein
MNEQITTQPDNYSPASAIMAAKILFAALPKTKQANYLGEFNELMVVLERVSRRFGIDPEKAL